MATFNEGPSPTPQPVPVPGASGADPGAPVPEEASPSAAPPDAGGPLDRPVIGLWFGAIIVGGILILLLFPWLPDHWPRIIATALPLVIGLVLGLTLLARRHMIVHLTCLAVVIALAVAAYWFVPTTAGLNFWSARQRIDDLQATPAGDLTELHHRRDLAAEAASQFEDLMPRIDEAVAAWVSRTTKESLTQSDTLTREGHLTEATDHLNALWGIVEGANPGNTTQSRNQIERARTEVAQARRDLAWKVGQARLEQAQKELSTIQREERYEDISDLVQRTNEYRDVVDKERLNSFLKDCATTAVRGDARAVEKLLAQNKLKEAFRRLKELSDKHAAWLAAVKGLERMPEFAETLGHVWQAQLKDADAQRDRLQAQKMYTAIDGLGDRIKTEWLFAPQGVRDEAELFADRCALVCVQAEVEEVATLVAKGDLTAASQRLSKIRTEREAALKRDQRRPGSKLALTNCLLAAHQRVAQEGLRKARKDFDTFIRADDYANLQRLKDEVDKAPWRRDAQMAGTDDKVQAFVAGCDFVLTVARTANKIPSVPAKP